MPWLVGSLFRPLSAFSFRDEMERANVPVWFPVCRRMTKPRRKRSPVEVASPAFGPYLFIRSSPEADEQAKSSPAFRGFLLVDGQKALLSDEVVERMREVKNWGDDPRAVGLEIGSKVLVTEGVMTGQRGVVASSSRRSPKVLINNMKVRVYIGHLSLLP